MSHELIKRRRRQLIVHSAIYYHYNSTIIDDHQYDDWTNELVKLHEENPDYSDELDEYFVDWKGETGYHFPKTPEILGIAYGVMKQYELKQNYVKGGIDYVSYN